MSLLRIATRAGLFDPRLRRPQRFLGVLLVPGVLVGVAGCSALTRTPPTAQAPLSPSAVAVPTVTAGAASQLPACGSKGELQVTSNAEAPARGRVPIVPGLTITRRVANADGPLHTGFIKGEVSELVTFRDIAAQTLRENGFTVTLGPVGTTLAGARFRGPVDGRLAVRPLCRGYLAVDYLVLKP